MTVQGAYNNGGEARTAGYMPVFAQENPADTVSFKDALSKTSSTQGAEIAPSGEKEENGFLSFLFGILDVINPLQHIPVVSTIYRYLTGDEISPMARIAGDTLYGGPIGAAVAVVNVAVEQSTGKDIGDTVLAMVTGNEKEQPQTMLASNFNNIRPAASATEIIWDDAISSPARELPLPLPPASPPQRNEVAELQPAFLSYKDAPPVSPPKGGLSDNAVLTAAKGKRDEEFVSITRADALTTFHPQEAPVDVAGTETPPELIAFKMMEALDKYGAMKRENM